MELKLNIKVVAEYETPCLNRTFMELKSRYPLRLTHATLVLIVPLWN